MTPSAMPSALSVDETIVIDETKGGAFQVKVAAGSSTFLVDEPAAVGGLDSGPNPYDLLSAAVGSCSLMTMRLYADRKNWPLERVRVKVTHHRDGLAGRDRFLREIQLFGPLDEAQRARIIAVSKRCPVHLTIERGSDVETVLLPNTPMDDTSIGRCEHMHDMSEACSDGIESAEPPVRTTELRDGIPMDE
jgi:putative redox protein